MYKKRYEITNKESERIKILKFWLIIMVVFIHTYGGINSLHYTEVMLEVPVWFEKIKYVISQIICSCAVQTYFFISAILLYRKNFKWKENITKKIKTLLIPYLILNTFWIFFYFIFQNIPMLKVFFNNTTNFISKWEFKDWINAYIGFENKYPIVYPLWFLRDLFALNILATIIKKIIYKFPNTSFLILMIMWLFVDNTYIFFLPTTTICFWGFGCYVVRKGIKLSEVDKIDKRYIWIAYLLIIILDLVTVNYKINILIHRFSILLGLVFWFACTTKLKNNKFKRIILFMSLYSFNIYLFHEMNLTILRKLYLKLFQNNIFFQLLEYFIVPIVIIIGCIIFSIITQKNFPRIYSVIVGGRINSEIKKKPTKN